MARQARDGTTFVAVPEVDHIDAEYEASDEEKAFENFRNSLDSGTEMATLRVSRIPETARGNPMAARPIYCFATPIDRYGFEELCEFIRETYGGGLYRLIGSRKGQKGTAFNQLLEIAEAVKKKDSDANKGPNVSGIMESVAAMLDRNTERTEALLARLTPAVPQGTTVDPAAMLEKSIALVTGMMARLQPAVPVATGPSLMEQIMMLGKIKEVFGDGGGGGSGDGANFWDAITTGMKQFGPALAALAQKGGGMPALAAPPPVPGPAATVGAPRQPNAPEVPPVTAQPTVNPIKRQVDMCLMYAKNGTTAEELAETILNMTPDERIADLKAFISRPTVIDEMARANAEVLSYRVYFDTLRAKLLEYIAEDEAAAAQNSAPEHDATVESSGSET